MQSITTFKLALVSTAVFGALAASPVLAADKVIKLGFSAPLTGPQAHYGEDMRNGLVLALEEANAQKTEIDGATARFEPVAKDDQADPRTAVQVAQQIVDGWCRRHAGPLLTPAPPIPASRVYNDAGIPQIAMATSPEYTLQGYDNTFRMMTSDTQQGAAVGQFIVKDLAAKKVALIDDRTRLRPRSD